jgi:hypothetical protein
LGKFDSRIDEGIFLGYSSDSKAYRCYNIRLNKIVMSTNVKVDDEKSHFTNQISKEAKYREEDEILQEDNMKRNKKKRKNQRKKNKKQEEETKKEESTNKRGR